MQGTNPSMRAALALLGLAEGADRDAVVHAYRRLARATHPDMSDAPDAGPRFAALADAYRQALGGADGLVTERAASPMVRIRVRTTREDPSPRPASTSGFGHRGPLIGSPAVVVPPIVAGPVRVVPPPFRPAAARPHRRGASWST